MKHTPRVLVTEDDITINCMACSWSSRRRKSKDFAWMMFRLHAEDVNA